MNGVTDSEFRSVEFSPDDALFALERYTVGPSESKISGAGAHTAFISMWKADTGERLWELSFHGTVSDMYFVGPGRGRLVLSRDPQVGDQFTPEFTATFIDSEGGRIIANLSQDAQWNSVTLPHAFPGILWIDPGGHRIITRSYYALRLGMLTPSRCCGN